MPAETTIDFRTSRGRGRRLGELVDAEVPMDERKKQVRIGIVGPGWIATAHKQGIDRSGCAEVVAITGGRGERLDRRGAEWGVPTAASLPDLVRDHRLDAAWVLSPTPVHYEQLRYLLSAGIPALVDKPPTLTLSEALEIDAELRRSGGFIMPGHNRVYEAAVQEARSIIEAGSLGKVVSANFTAVGRPPVELMEGWRKSVRNPGGGALADSGYHLVYLSIYLLGPPTSVFGSQATVSWELQSEDTATAVLCYEGGVAATLLQSWATENRTRTPDVTIWGTEGTLTLGDGELSLNGRDVAVDREREPFTEMVRTFVAALDDGVPPVHSFGDAVTTMAICDAYYRSCETGCREAVEDRSSSSGPR
jgi:predicted dehydrogenase